MDEEFNKPRVGLARNIARKILQETSIKNPPILIKTIVAHIRKTQTLFVMPWELGNISGTQINSGDASAIGYNSIEHRHRQRFTVAHEIGHLLLGHTSRDSTYDLKSKKPFEVEANKFAAELLMPLDLLKKDFQKSTREPSKLAELYYVSKEAMWWRLLDMKII